MTDKASTCSVCKLEVCSTCGLCGCNIGSKKDCCPEAVQNVVPYFTVDREIPDEPEHSTTDVYCADELEHRFPWLPVTAGVLESLEFTTNEPGMLRITRNRK